MPVNLDSELLLKSHRYLLNNYICRIYPATFKNMIPLPDPNASPNSSTHPNNYPEFPAGFTVMALYPDTSCFYRAEVIQGPKDPQNTRVRLKISHRSNPNESV